MQFKTVAKVTIAALRYVRDDLTAKYGLETEARCVIRGPGIGVGNASAGPLTIESEKGGERVVLSAAPFPASSGEWNGPNVIPDDLRDGSLEASLWHDLIWGHAAELSGQLGMSTADLLEWSNGILAAAWRGYGKRKYGRSEASGRRRGWLAYNVCRIGAWIKALWLKLCCMALATALLAGCDGCATPPDWEVESASEVEVLYAATALPRPCHAAATDEVLRHG